MKRPLFFAVLALFFLSCNERKGNLTRSEKNGEASYSVEGDDKAMDRAIAKARKTYPEFLNVIRTQDSTASGFSVKVKFKADKHIEHLWFAKLYFKNGKLFGILDCTPVYVNWINQGEAVEIKQESVTDWMYFKNDSLTGAYTVKVLYSKMDTQQRRKFMKEMKLGE